MNLKTKLIYIILPHEWHCQCDNVDGTENLILMHLFRGLSSKLIIPACVRPSVRPSPSSGKLKTYAFAPYCLKFQKITYVFYST